MVLRLIGTIVGLIVIAFFVGFNLDNRCDVSVIFHTFKNAPVFITILISFIVGSLFTMPFAFLFHAGRKKERSGSQRDVPAAGVKKARLPFHKKDVPAEPEAGGADAAKKSGSAQAAEPAPPPEGASSGGVQQEGGATEPGA